MNISPKEYDFSGVHKDHLLYCNFWEYMREVWKPEALASFTDEEREKFQHWRDPRKRYQVLSGSSRALNCSQSLDQGQC